MTDQSEFVFTSDMTTVELVKYSAADSDVVWAACLSTAAERSRDEIGKDPARSKDLIDHLMRERFGAPWEHSTMTFLIHAPGFVFHELSSRRAPGWSYSEASGKYYELEPVFYVPAEDQGLVRADEPGTCVLEPGNDHQGFITQMATRTACKTAYAECQMMLREGIAPEIARTILPASLYSSMYITCNARSLMHFLGQCTQHEPTAAASFPEREIETVAKALEEEWARLMPLTHAAFNTNARQAP